MYNIRRNIDLSKYSRFCVGGAAEYFFEPTNIDELVNFIKSKKYKEPLNVVGAGSNILFSDGLIEGTIISTKKLDKIVLKDNVISCDCGVLNLKLFNFAKKNHIGGFEFLGCIPGTIGGSCRLNAGCYGSEIKDILLDITTIDHNGNTKTFNNEQCNFSYRKTGLDNELIFLTANFKYTKFTEEKDIENKFNEMMEKKKQTQPIAEKTCGSTFINLPEMPAWKVIQELKLQGVNFNGAEFSNKHANFLVNAGCKNSKPLMDLINLTIRRAKEELNVDLELEIKTVGNR